MEYLKESQVPHVNKIIEIFGISLFANDFSVMGAGKTHSTTAIAKEIGLPMFVFGPRGSYSYWHKVAKEMDVEILYFSTYESLRSIRGCQPKHGYLTRYDYEDHSVGFSPTKAFRKIVAKGILLVCDECQKIKNNTSQTKAVRALIREILDNGGLSRVLMLSGTPFEEHKNAVNYFRLVGFISHPKLYTINVHQEFVPLGLDELIEQLSFFQPEATEELVLSYSPFTKKNVQEFVFAAFTEIIVPYFTSAMPSPIIDYKKDVANGYYRFENEKDAQKLIKAISALQKATGYNPAAGTVVHDNTNVGAITTALKRVEVCKIPLWVKNVHRDMKATKKGKVILFLNYNKTVAKLSELLKEYEPVIYTGKLRNIKQEKAALEAFMEGGRRLLIANLKKGGVSINLHDTKGNEPRTSYLSPNFSIIDMHQASQRTYRCDLKSNAVIRVTFGDVGDGDVRILESKILKALSRKTENMKQILKLQAKEGCLFPGEYPEIREAPATA